MMPTEIQAEWNLVFLTRIGILMDSAAGEPTPEQKAIARQEADATIKILREQSEDKLLI